MSFDLESNLPFAAHPTAAMTSSSDIAMETIQDKRMRRTKMISSDHNWVSDTMMARSLLIVVSLLAALSFGVTFGDYFSNHPVYLLDGLRQTRGDFLSRDWFATATVQYHQRFTWLVVVLESAGFLKWGLAIIHTATIAASIGLMALILRALDPERYLAAWLVFVLIFVAVDETKSLAASYLFSPALQPSGLSALGYLGAITFFIHKRYWLSGLSLAAAGLFHTNYLILGFLFFGCAHLALGWRGIIRRGWAQFALPLFILALELPNIVGTLGLEVAPALRADASRIFLSNLAQHYLPATFWHSYIPFLGWQIAGFAFFAGQREQNAYLTQFWSLHLGLLALLSVATFFSSIILIEPVARLFVLRITPFSLMFAQMLFALAVTRMWIGRDRQTYAVLTRNRAMIASFGLCLVITHETVNKSFGHTNTLIYVLMLLVIWLAYWGKERISSRLTHWNVGPSAQLLAMSAIVIALGAGALKADFRPHTFSLVCQSCQKKYEMELYDWVRTSTGAQSLFLIPHKLRGMRIFGERAIVVDAKGIPYDPENLKEWNRRMGLVRGFFKTGNVSQLNTLLSDYKPDYIVFNKRQNRDAVGDIVFENRLFIVTRAPIMP